MTQITKKELLELIDTLEEYDHVTIMKFTTHWKIAKGTPALHRIGRSVVSRLRTFPSFLDALKSMKEWNEYTERVG
jgi:hypothetical protein